jgi:DNA-binding transcriptional LysR family regulator
MDIKSWGVVKRFAELGMGTGFIPDYLLRCDSQTSGLRTVDIGLPTVEYSINAFYYGKRAKLSKNCRLFLDSLDAFLKVL